MGRTRIFIVLGIATVGAIALMLVVGALTRHKTPPPQTAAVAAPAQPMARVMVAKHDLPVGTRLGPNDLAWQDWPANAINAAFITDGQGARTQPADTTAQLAVQANQTVHAAAAAVTGGDQPMQQLYGSIVREAILANEPITNAKLVRAGDSGYMAVVLQPGMRAVSVPVNVNTAAGGFIMPGDHVDVVSSHAVDASSNGGHAGVVAETVLRNVRVLAIDQNSQAPKSGQQTQVGATATLEVTAADTDVLARAKAQGEIILALRPYTDAGGPSSRGGNDDQNAGQVRIFRPGQPAEVVAIQ